MMFKKVKLKKDLILVVTLGIGILFSCILIIIPDISGGTNRIIILIDKILFSDPIALVALFSLMGALVCWFIKVFSLLSRYKGDKEEREEK